MRLLIVYLCHAQFSLVTVFLSHKSYNNVMTAALMHNICNKHLSLKLIIVTCSWVPMANCSTLMDQQLRSFEDRSPQFLSLMWSNH